jgi:DNA-binding beta-propeller fold protein YncE
VRLLPSILAFFLLFLFACGPERRIEPDNLFWPLPPSQPRIKYIQSIYAEDDIGREYSFMEMLLGKRYIDSLARPYGVFTRHGRVYATDIVMNCVMVFDPGSKRLHIAGEEGNIRTPAGAAAEASGRLFVADAAAGKVLVYDGRGKYVTAFPLKNAKPVAIALDEQRGRLYVADRLGHKVMVLSVDGDMLFEFGSRGSTDGRFNMPLGITVDRDGKVYVLDSGNFRVQIFDTEGRFLSGFGSVGDQAGHFSNPKGIAVDSEGHIYVTDAAFSNFQIFDQQGNILLYVGELGTAPGQMYLPAGISIDENDRIYIADQLNGRIEVFQYLRAP